MATWFTYEYCRDVAATAHFYGELIGLEQVWFEADDVAFVHDGVQLSFTRNPDAPQADGWAFQPGWCHGQLPDAPPVLPIRSTSIALAPADFRAAVAACRRPGCDPSGRSRSGWATGRSSSPTPTA